MAGIGAVMNKVTPNASAALGYGVAGAGAAGIAWKAWEHIGEGELALRSRFKRGRQIHDSRLPWGPRAGEVYKVVEAGPHLTMPFAHRYVRTHARDRTREEPYMLTVLDKSDYYYNLDAKFTWGVLPMRDNSTSPPKLIDYEAKYGIPYNELLYRALFRLGDPSKLDTTVEWNICATALGRLLTGQELKELDSGDVQHSLIEETRDELLGYGCDLRSVKIANLRLTPEEQLGRRLGSHVIQTLGAGTALGAVHGIGQGSSTAVA